MQNTEPLVLYGTVVNVIVACFILIPYLRGKSDLCTAWNVLLVGVGLFVGVGCYEVRWGDFDWPQLQWFQPSVAEVTWFMWATTAFLVTLFLSYYYNPLATYITSRTFRKWAPENGGTLLFGLFYCIALASAALVSKQVFFVGLVLFQLSHKALVFGCVFAFILWYRNKSNLLWLGVFLAVLAWASMYAMLVYTGRRLLLAVFLGPMLYVYWANLRYWRPMRCLSLMALGAVFVFLVGMGYNSFRHFSVVGEKQARTVGNVVRQMKNMGGGNKFEYVRSHKLHYLSQWAVNYSLVCERYVRMGQLPPRPLNTFKFCLAYPVPRSIWPNKPVAIGEILVHDMVGYANTNWGVGIAGHGAFEGGILTLIFYAIMTGMGIRFIDDPLRAQPTNPYLIAMLAAAAPNIMAFPRGDMGTMVLETGECFVFVVLINTATRLLYGTNRGTQVRRAIMPSGSFVAHPRPL